MSPGPLCNTLVALLLAGAGLAACASGGLAQTVGTAQGQGQGLGQGLGQDQSGLQTGPQLRLYFQLPPQGDEAYDPGEGHDQRATAAGRRGPGYGNGYGYGYDQPPAPQPAPPPSRCRDYGSFAVVGPSPQRGGPISTQSWNDCADLPGRGGPQPTIGAEIQISPQTPTPLQQQGGQQGGQQAGTRGPARLRLQ